MQGIIRNVRDVWERLVHVLRPVGVIVGAMAGRLLRRGGPHVRRVRTCSRRAGRASVSLLKQHVGKDALVQVGAREMHRRAGGSKAGDGQRADGRRCRGLGA